MAKGEQRKEKMVKKPKKDSGARTPNSSPSDRPIAPTTSVIPRGKIKDK
ncbi:hypothetical protein [Ottowia caeni]|nr:hypothetical protein [Ottowia caeni]